MGSLSFARHKTDVRIVPRAPGQPSAMIETSFELATVLEAECLGYEDDVDASRRVVVDDQCLCEQASGVAGVLHTRVFLGQAVFAYAAARTVRDVCLFAHCDTEPRSKSACRRETQVSDRPLAVDDSHGPHSQAALRGSV
jgi:hypothetical protein